MLDEIIEAAAQERGLLNGIWAKSSASEVQFAKMVELQDRQRLFRNRLESFADAKSMNSLKAAEGIAEQTNLLALNPMKMRGIAAHLMQRCSCCGTLFRM